MLEQIKFINHMNEVIESGKDGIFANKNDLRDFSWNVISKNDRISGFKKGIVNKTIPLIIFCNSEEEGLATKNRLFEIMEKDVLAKKHGRIIIGDYYMKCFVTGSKKTEYLSSKRCLKLSLTIKTDFPYWVKETTTTFNVSRIVTGKNLDYNNDFPYDYSSNTLDKKLINDDFVASNFRMRIFGVANAPEITIGGHTYSVNVNIAKNEYLTIDSIEKTIILTGSDGSTTNCFNLRNKDIYVFEKIPCGTLEVIASSDFVFDITLLEERGEPKWT